MFTPLALAPLAHVGAPWGFGLIALFVIGHVFWFVVIVALIAFAVAGRRRRFARWAGQGHYGHYGQFGPGGRASSAAEATLAERFAQGDIDEKEYRARLEVLRANNAPQQPQK